MVRSVLSMKCKSLPRMDGRMFSLNMALTQASNGRQTLTNMSEILLSFTPTWHEMSSRLVNTFTPKDRT
jgi:hypothetical protein